MKIQNLGAALGLASFFVLLLLDWRIAICVYLMIAANNLSNTYD